jgi:hypothetical protein
LKTLTMHRCGVHTLSIATFLYSHQHQSQLALIIS